MVFEIIIQKGFLCCHFVTRPTQFCRTVSNLKKIDTIGLKKPNADIQVIKPVIKSIVFLLIILIKICKKKVLFYLTQNSV
jgi:hypothetical protein